MKIQVLTASALYAALAAAPGIADGLEPGSVLVFPFHQSTAAGPAFTAVSVTNTNLQPLVPNITLGGSTGVHYQYVNLIPDPSTGLKQFPLDCMIADRIEFLTPADTRAVLTNCDNGTAGSEGYLVVSATDPNTFDTDWSHNYLVGSELVVNFETGGLWYLNAIPFKSPKAKGMPTDMDGDGELDFDGIEYEGIPNELYIDSFVGDLFSSLVLINLSGGVAFTANIRFDIFNDNERALSSTYAFRCWVEERLVDISLVFDGTFLANNTINDPTELDTDCDGVNDYETGWARIRGLNHSSPVESCPDAALLGAIGQAATANIGARRLWESKGKQLDGDFLKTGTDDPECGIVQQFPPLCSIAVTPNQMVFGANQAGNKTIPITFNGSGSSDPDGGAIVSFSWDFGDGTGASGPVVMHAFQGSPTTALSYIVTLTVTDNEGQSASCPVSILVD